MIGRVVLDLFVKATVCLLGFPKPAFKLIISHNSGFRQSLYLMSVFFYKVLAPLLDLQFYIMCP